MRGNRILDLRGRAHSPERVVLVRDRNAEDGHDGVADKLLDPAAVTLENCAEVLEVAAHARTKRLRVGRFAEAVEPTRSQKRTVTTLRDSRSGSATASAPPQELQNRASSGFSAPQCGQAAMRGV